MGKTLNQSSDRHDRVARRQAQLRDESRTFHRNSVISGSRSSRVTSAVESRGQLKSDRVVAHELYYKKRRLQISAISAGVVMITVLFALYQFTLSVQITSNANESLSSQRRNEYTDRTEAYLSMHPIERFRLLLNNDSLTRHLQQAFPEVETANVESGASGFVRSTVQITPRVPVAKWTIDGAPYYVDSKGVSFQQNDFNEPSVTVRDDSGLPVSADGAVTTDQFMRYIGQLVSVSDSYGLSIQEVIIPEGATRQINATLEGKSYYAKLLIDRGPAEQAEALSKAVAFIDRQGEEVQYVDVRVSGRVFYR